ncbi:hypothetical protein sce2704 [Sorangium cellulosum So ce56]|uniref:DUF2169 domain-containing protein n=1 Tax=Sorangium cellulosum (strain So ce56) TaxID=448385 RepID=A9GAG8_SORC5|nr:DUF2169 domain-containing protein [Sorangium cellulosum]CAN92863.1 hypothetical protein sce2704 [Sorangium cellulosum So ce56]
MDVVSDGPLPVASLLWQVRSLTWVLTVVCKATFTLAPGESPLAPAQEPIRERDAHLDDDPARSLIEASDLAPLKQGADVVLVGHAHAPGGSPARSLIARMAVGEIDKPIQVFCDRLFTQEGELQEGAHFTAMPLAYERAAGGPDTDNPAGIHREARDARGRAAVPNLLPVDRVVASPDDPIAAVGFGPIAPTWPLRRRRLGRHAAAWSSGALLSSPLPEDLDRTFFNVAPLDQRLLQLREDEQIVLENLHPRHPRLVTSLPGVRPRATVTGRAGGPRDLAMRCDTLVIDTDRLLCTLTWRGQLPLASPKESGQIRVSLERPARQAPAEAPTPSAPGPQPPPRVAPAAPRVKPPSLGPSKQTVDMPAKSLDVVQASIMPFRAGPPAPPPPEAPAPRPAEPPGVRPKPSSTEGQTSDLTEEATKVPLPFVAPSSAPPPATASNTPPPNTPPPNTPSPIPAPPIAMALPGEPVSPWAAGAPLPGSSAMGMIPHAPAAPQTIGAMLAGTGGAADAGAALAPAQRDALTLVWFDRKSVPRIVRKPAWQRLLDAMEAEPIDPEVDDPALSDEPAEIEDRAQVFEILDRGAAADVAGVHGALARAAGKRGMPVPPLELVEGELSLSFDEVETLKALVSTATPLATGDDALAAALGAAEKFLATPGVSTAPAVAEALCGKIREALGHGKKGRVELANEQVERALLEQRHYQKRKVLGGPHLRGLLRVTGETQPLVIYLPASIAEALPLAARFRARVIAAVHPAMDEREAEPVALQAAALGRVVQVRQRRAS